MLIVTTTSHPLETMLAPLIIVAGVVVLGVILTLSVRGRLARSRAARPDAREMMSLVRAAASRDRTAGDDAASELLELTRRLSAQLDNKAERLEQLITEAQAIIDRMQDSAPAAPGKAPRAGPAPPVASRPAGDGADPFTRAVYELADAGHDPVEIAVRLEEQIGKVELVLALRRA